MMTFRTPQSSRRPCGVRTVGAERGLLYGARRRRAEGGGEMERSTSSDSTLGGANDSKAKDALPKGQGEGERERSLPTP